MSELIDSHVVLIKLNEMLAKATTEFESVTIYRFIKIIEDIPTIHSVRRCGHWIPIEYDSFADGVPVWDKWECSECGHEHDGDENTLTAFCPNCGAKMRKGCADNA